MRYWIGWKEQERKIYIYVEEKGGVFEVLNLLGLKEGRGERRMVFASLGVD